MEPVGPLLRLQVSVTCPYPEPDVPFPLLRLYSTKVQSKPETIYPFRNKATFYGEVLLVPRPKPCWRTAPFRLFATVYSIYLHYPPYWKPFFPPQPEDAPCCGNSDPLTWMSLENSVLLVTDVTEIHFTCNIDLFITSIKRKTLSLVERNVNVEFLGRSCFLDSVAFMARTCDLGYLA